MSLFRRPWGLVKMGLLYLAGRRITPADYACEYDQVSPTYDLWLSRMARHTDLLLDTSLLPQGRPLRIIDLACGTGYITGKLLERLSGQDISVTCVDISSGMIERCRESITDPRAEFVVADGLDYLASLPTGSCDAVYCGWGMVYFPHKKLIPLCKKVLRPGGIVAGIMNCRGTLAGLEDLFIKVMSEHPGELDKVMDIRFYMPESEQGFVSRFDRHDFTTLRSGGGEEVVYWDTPEQLYDWLRCTGVIAGTGKLFHDLDRIKPALVERIASDFHIDGQYRINHKFVYGVFSCQSLTTEN